jgi:quinol monooxygenase YgiN
VLIRTVRMTFRPDRVEDFLEGVFRPSAPRIRAFPGCRHLALWRDERFPNVLTTYSLWDDAGALAAYRASELFRSTWARTTPLFAAAPAAHSQEEIWASGEPGIGKSEGVRR